MTERGLVRKKSRAGWTEVKTMPVSSFGTMKDSEVDEPPDLDDIHTQIERFMSETDCETSETKSALSDYVGTGEIIGDPWHKRFAEDDIFKEITSDSTALKLIEETSRLKDNPYAQEMPERDSTSSTTLKKTHSLSPRPTITESGDDVEFSPVKALKDLICTAVRSQFIPAKESESLSLLETEDRKPMALDLQKIHENGYDAPRTSTYVDFTEITSNWMPAPSSPLRIKVNEIMKLMKQPDWEDLRELHTMLKRAGRIDPLILSEFSFRLIENCKGKSEAFGFIQEIEDDIVDAAIQFAKGMLNAFHNCVPESDDDGSRVNYDSEITGAQIPDDVKDYYNRSVESMNQPHVTPKSRRNQSREPTNTAKTNRRNPNYAHVKSRYMDGLKKATTEGKSKKVNNPNVKLKKKGVTKISKESELSTRTDIFVPEPGSAISTIMDTPTEYSGFTVRENRQFHDERQESPKTEEQPRKRVSSQSLTNNEVVMASKLTEMELGDEDESKLAEKFFLQLIISEASKRLIPGTPRKLSATSIQSCYEESNFVKEEFPKETVVRPIVESMRPDETPRTTGKPDQAKSIFSIRELYRLVPQLRPTILDNLIVNVVLAYALAVTGKALLPNLETSDKGIMCSISLNLRDKLRSLLIRALRLVDDF